MNDRARQMIEVSKRFMAEYGNAAQKHGPGTELKNILANFGIHHTGNCRCMFYVAEMNRNGIQWTRDNLDYIARHMEQEVSQRGWKLPYLRHGAAVLVRLALWKTTHVLRKHTIVSNPET